MADVLLSCVRLDKDAKADKSEGVASMLGELSQLCCCMTYARNARQNAARVIARLAASVAYRAHGCTDAASDAAELN